MAKTVGPLFSLGATGALAKTLVYSVWKGVPTVRQFQPPSNPNTAAQQAQRALFAVAVAFWRNVGFTAPFKLAWDRAAGLLTNPMSGFNAFCQQALRAAPGDPDASFGYSQLDDAFDNFQVEMANLDDFGTGDETGNFTARVGLTPSGLETEFTSAIAAGTVTYDFTGSFASGQVVFVQLVKNVGAVPVNRTGILQVTLT